MAEEKEKAKAKPSVWKIIAIVFIIVTVILMGALAGVVVMMPKGNSQTTNPALPGPLISVEGKELEVYLSMTDDESDVHTALSIEGLTGLDATTLEYIKQDRANITENVGDKSDRANKTYFAFSFYFINRSHRAVAYDLSVNVHESTGNILNAVRVMMIEGEAGWDGGEIFAKPEATQEGKDRLSANVNYTTKPFKSAEVICSLGPKNLAQNAKVKQTMVVWLEGWDIDCTEQILSNSLTMSLTLSAQ